MADSPHQNRVDPFGSLIAHPARGTLFGNRGVLHDERGQIVRRHQLKRWIYCRLEFKGRSRELLQPGRYTELFFLDEATALAAGHRPCAECMRDRFNEFRATWGGGRQISAPELDAALHPERLTSDGEQATFTALPGELPDGVIVVAEHDVPELLWAGRLRRWTPDGYAGARPAPAQPVRVLTPRSTVAAIAAGFRPAPRCVLHPPLGP